jgi:hypothetical protein
MPRNMSFAITTNQVRNRTKTVTRRNGWWNLKSGDILNAVEKGMGLKKGEKIKVICQIKVISVKAERLADINGPEIRKEGFPEMTKFEFLKMFMKTHKDILPSSFINRIEFEYL